MDKPIYVLGTNLYHDGSVCLLKDGKVCAAIEKERITRFKHDGLLDARPVSYCLEKENISFKDLSLVVQNSTVSRYLFPGKRPIQDEPSVPVVTISHHLAHAYSAFGRSGFDESAVLVIDGTGNSLADCVDLTGEGCILNKDIPPDRFDSYRETNSYYHFTAGAGTLICKEVSELYNQRDSIIPPGVNYAVGDFFGAVSSYCFRYYYDAGKLMELASYGDPTVFREEVFHFKDGIVSVDHSVLKNYYEPSRSEEDFKKRFSYFANIANWAQRELERAVHYIIQQRYEIFPSDNLIYTGAVACNAVLNSKIMERAPFRNIYIPSDAGDNGIAFGCAYYGWLEVLKKKKADYENAEGFGKKYTTEMVRESISLFHNRQPDKVRKKIDSFFQEIDRVHEEVPSQFRELLLQFNVSNAGVYQVEITKEYVKNKAGAFATPTSEVSISDTDLYNGLENPSHFRDLFNMNRVGMTNSSELAYFMHVMELLKRVPEEGKKNGRNTPLYQKHVHYEGDGYIHETARLLSEGKIVGWFQDEAEFGPRALGRRSILADPRRTGIRNFINTQIRFREEFRPLTASILREDLSLYFETDTDAPFRTRVNSVKEDRKEELGEIIHADGTCKIQTVTPLLNPKFASLLAEFRRTTGISVLLNTSLCSKGMPIVETPGDALLFFYNCKLDYLVMQDIIIKKKIDP